MTKRSRNFWIELAVFAAVAAAALTAIVASEMRPMNKDDIKMNAADIRSFAAAAGEHSQRHSNGQLTEQFFVSQVELLADKISTTRQTLETEAKPDTESARVEAADLAGQLEAAVERLEHEAGDRLSVKSDLDRIRATAKQLEEKLSNE